VQALGPPMSLEAAGAYPLGVDPDSSSYPPMPESEHPEFARRVVLELGREDDFFLWELAHRVAQLLGVSADTARVLTTRACAELVSEGSIEVVRSDDKVRSTCPDPVALDASAWNVQTGSVLYEASITARGVEVLDETWAEERREGRRWPHTI
jgi:hypothetical protein